MIVPSWVSATHPPCERLIDLPRPRAHPFQFSGAARNWYTTRKGRLIRTLTVRDSTGGAGGAVRACPSSRFSVPRDANSPPFATRTSKQRIVTTSATWPTLLTCVLPVSFLILGRMLTARKEPCLEQISHPQGSCALEHATCGPWNDGCSLGKAEVVGCDRQARTVRRGVTSAGGSCSAQNPRFS